MAALVAALLLLAAAFAMLLTAADRGMFDDRITSWASARLGRPVRFKTITLHLLSRKPSITIEDLVVGNPGWIGHGDLAEVDRIKAKVALLPLTVGRLDARAIAISGAHLHLIRFAPGRNNWTFTAHPKPGPAFAPLAGVTRFSIVGGRIDVEDHGRDLFLAGPFRHDAGGDKPFHLTAAGTLKGFAVSLIASGGQLSGAGVGPAWPFSAHFVDAATAVYAQGVAAQPFDLSSYDLGMASAGPDLADLGYLFNFSMPNSGPYHLQARARSDGEHFGFSNIVGRVGQSDVRGHVISDHSGRRRRIIAAFDAQTLARTDIDALLAPIPPRAQARSVSGIVKAVSTGRWILPDAGFGLARLRASDFDLSVQADRTTGYALPLRRVSARIISSDGLLRFAHFDSSLYSGRLEGSGLLDARADMPRIVVRGQLRAARLAEIAPGQGQPAQALLDVDIAASGAGPSLHKAAGAARGTASIRLTGAAVPRRAAWILGGDLLRALGDVGSEDAPGSRSIACAAASLRSDGGGLFRITGLGVQTALGIARGSGLVDLGRERLDILLQGQPAEKRLFQVAAPVHIAGPLLAPRLTVLPGDKARAAGLKGALGVALTPLAGILPVKGRAPPAPLAPEDHC